MNKISVILNSTTYTLIYLIFCTFCISVRSSPTPMARPVNQPDSMTDGCGVGPNVGPMAGGWWYANQAAFSSGRPSMVLSLVLKRSCCACTTFNESMGIDFCAPGRNYVTNQTTSMSVTTLLIINFKICALYWAAATALNHSL